MEIKIQNSEFRSFSADIALEKRSDNVRIVTIRAAIFNKLSKRISWGFKEKIEPGAFDGADMTDVVAVLNHNFDILFARTSSGTLKLEVDKTGLSGSFQVPNTRAGNDLLEMVDRRDINKASFQFIVDKDRWINDPNEGEVRIIEKFRKIIDISPVTFEAYPDTDVSLDVAKRSYNSFYNKIPWEVEHARARFEYDKLIRH